MRYRSVLLFLFLIFNSCSDNFNLDCEDVYCFEIFYSHSLKVKYPDGRPVGLTKYVTIRERKNKEIDIQSKLDLEARLAKTTFGIYPVLDGTHDDLVKNPEEKFTFKGYIGDDLIVEENFTFGLGCCGVYLVSGPYEVIID